MGLVLVSKNYFILVRDPDELIVTEFNDLYIQQLRSEGWKCMDSFNVRQKRAIKR